MTAIKWLVDEVDKFHTTEEPVNTILQVFIHCENESKKFIILSELRSMLPNVRDGTVNLCFYSNMENPFIFVNRQGYRDLLKAEIMMKFFNEFQKSHNVKIDYILSRPLAPASFLNSLH